jgi:hypothetical protein
VRASQLLILRRLLSNECGNCERSPLSLHRFYEVASIDRKPAISRRPAEAHLARSPLLGDAFGPVGLARSGALRRSSGRPG